MPLRVSAMLSLGAYLNVFAIERFMDELAAGADPVAFPLHHYAACRCRTAGSRTRSGYSRPVQRGA